MSRKPLLCAALMIAGLLTLSPLSAANGPTEFSVPFQFYAGDTVLPAGTYQVGLDQAYNRIKVSASDMSKSVCLLPHRTESKGNDLESGRTALVFHRIGDSYFLREVWRDGREQGFAFGQTKAEKSAIRQGGLRQVALIHPR